MATNSMNGKRYIGITRKEKFRKRKYTHFRDAIKGRLTSPLFHRAINKYGKESFEWSILEEFEYRIDAELGETRHISELRPEYNIYLGGNLGAYGSKRPTDTLSTISKPVMCLNDGKIYYSSAEACRAYGISGGRLSTICNKGGTTKGLSFKFFSDATPPAQRQKTPNEIEKHRKGVEAGRQKAIDKVRLPIIKLGDNIIYNSVIEAAKENKIPSPTLHSSLRRNTLCHGLKFRYLDDCGIL